MEERDKKAELLGSAPIPRALLAMGLPAMIGMTINASYNLVDAYFVGRLGTSQMGAISIFFPLGQIVVGLGLLFGTGAGSYISRLLGRGDRKKADSVASTALCCSVAVGAAAIILARIFLRPILILLGATESILPHAEPYARICLLSSIFSVFNVTMNNIVTSEGAPRTSMRALLAGALLNILLDPLFIFALKLGVAGAAIATAISAIVSSSVYVGYMLRRKGTFSFRVSACRFSGETMSEILKIGVPTLAFQLLAGLSMTLVNARSRQYGDSMIAGMGAATRIASMGSLLFFGFIKGFQPIAGYSYGARNYDRLRETIKTTAVWSAAYCALFGSLLAAFPGAIISQFSDGDADMILAGAQSLRAQGLSFILFGFSTFYSSLFLALGQAKRGFILGACRQGICFIPAILALPLIWGKGGILYAQSVADIAAAMVTLLMARKLNRELAAKKDGEASGSAESRMLSAM